MMKIFLKFSLDQPIVAQINSFPNLADIFLMPQSKCILFYLSKILKLRNLFYVYLKTSSPLIH